MGVGLRVDTGTCMIPIPRPKNLRFNATVGGNPSQLTYFPTGGIRGSGAYRWVPDTDTLAQNTAFMGTFHPVVRQDISSLKT